MSQKIIAISINASWNIVNFRTGLVRRLQQAGYRVVALTPTDGCSAQLAMLGIDHLPLEMDTKGLSPVRDLLLLWRYWLTLRRLRPAVFLGYTVKPNIYGSLAAHALRIKVINNVSGLGTAFIRDDFLTRLVSLLYRLAFRRASTVFFQNEDDRRMFRERGIVRPDRARLLPGSGIDLVRFQPAAAASQANGFTFLFVGRLLRFKGIGEFVEAVRFVRGTGAGARFQLLGSIDPENPNSVDRSQVERWVSEGVVEYLGEADDVRPFIANAGCVVLPSYREGLPRTLLEAAAMGKPMIATDVPGCRQVVADRVNGFLCAPRDPASLAGAMLTMLRLSEEERTAMGQAGRTMVVARFDERLVMDLYLEAIEAALKPVQPMPAQKQSRSTNSVR